MPPNENYSRVNYAIPVYGNVDGDPRYADDGPHLERHGSNRM